MPLRQNTPSHWLILVLAELSKIKRKIAVSTTTICCPCQWGKLQYRHPIGRVSTVRKFFSRKSIPPFDEAKNAGFRGTEANGACRMDLDRRQLNEVHDTATAIRWTTYLLPFDGEVLHDIWRNHWARMRFSLRSTLRQVTPSFPAISSLV